MNNNLPPITTPATKQSIKPLPSSEAEVDQLSEATSSFLSANEKNDEISKRISKFEIIEKFNYIQSIPEDKSHEGLETTISFSRSKKEVGRCNLGMLGKIGDKEFLIKEGMGHNLLNQIVNYYRAEDRNGVERRVGFIVETYLRSIGTEKDTLESLQKELLKTLDDFFKSKDGEKILKKEKKIDISNVNEILKGLVTQNQKLKNILGIAVFIEVINGVAGQQIVNDYQRTYLASHQIPNAKLLLVGDNPLIGVQFIDLEKDKVKPFDQFLWESFVPTGTTLEDIRQAAALIKWGKNVDEERLQAARQLLSKINLEEGKKGLTDKLNKGGLNGLAASIFIRLTMGESADLGPDNMLLVEDKDGRNQIVNIDVTGFRYPRKGDELKNKRLGWDDIIQDLDTSSDELLNKLFKLEVFSNRYISGADEVHSAIVEVLQDVIKEQASNEVKSVCNWYASPNTQAYKSLLEDLAEKSVDCIDESVRPDKDVMRVAIERNCSLFIDALAQLPASTTTTPTSHASALVGINSENFSINSLG